MLTQDLPPFTHLPALAQCSPSTSDQETAAQATWLWGLSSQPPHGPGSLSGGGGVQGEQCVSTDILLSHHRDPAPRLRYAQRSWPHSSGESGWGVVQAPGGSISGPRATDPPAQPWPSPQLPPRAGSVLPPGRGHPGRPLTRAPLGRGSPSHQEQSHPCLSNKNLSGASRGPRSQA